MNCVAAACAVAVALLLSGSSPVAAQTGTPVYVQYEGFIKEADGSIVLSFGYFNTNDADVAIAAGEFNRFLPTSDDRGQPTTFYRGRHRSACVVRLPAGVDPNLQWSVTHGGYKSTTTARVLDPLYALEDTSERRALSALAHQSVMPGRCLTAPDPARPRRPEIM